MEFIDGKDVAIIGRQKNAVVLHYNRGILITTDILRNNNNEGEPHIDLDDQLERIDMFANDILLEAKNSSLPENASQSIVYGENLVELLRWMIRKLKSHSHPPNGTPIPDFFVEADQRSRNMGRDLLNKHIQSR